MKKNNFALLLTTALILTSSAQVLAQDFDYNINSIAATESQASIDRTATIDVASAGKWFGIDGDNNWVSETVEVTNQTDSTIRVSLTTNSYDTLARGESARYKIPYNAGKYTFWVRFDNDTQTGYITIHMATVG